MNEESKKPKQDQKQMQVQMPKPMHQKPDLSLEDNSPVKQRAN